MRPEHKHKINVSHHFINVIEIEFKNCKRETKTTKTLLAVQFKRTQIAPFSFHHAFNSNERQFCLRCDCVQFISVALTMRLLANWVGVFLLHFCRFCLFFENYFFSFANFFNCHCCCRCFFSEFNLVNVFYSNFHIFPAEQKQFDSDTAYLHQNFEKVDKKCLISLQYCFCKNK